MKKHKFFPLALTPIAVSILIMNTKAVLAFNITSSPNSSDFLDAILGDTMGLNNFEISASGNPMAFGLFQDDPFGLDSGVVLSTGKVEDLPGVNTLDGTQLDSEGIPLRDLSTNFNGTCVPISETFSCESTTVNISFDVDDKIEKVFFNYIFGSEEFVEFGGKKFNDSFELLLNGQNLAKLSDGQAVSINNLIPNSEDVMSFHSDYINNPVGSQTQTKLDGYTQTLGFEGILNKNERNTLTIQITDIGDNQFDSAVFIQGRTLGTRPTPVTAVPEPNLWLGYLSLGAIAYLYKQRNL
ncbi:choice-of-anchor L domain-containing protein [Oscillatoriales cyanobacterium LEGE 11467]|uniref:Choice-of-anchor L domain-containing protein n=1 Tax=Zarconia navalis LEGE 11467 TaxID=1828826 RepID=A0A928Z693_9CYAN|nr:choice-of-anchor L domain-containing protein [Zarconia navalis]MBE9039220.1 choice-of-anchor L domain-containing protein [Zarconia navalis LEGE 11467]